MTQGVDITGLAAWIVLALPFFGLATAIGLALRKRGVPEGKNWTDAPRGRYGAPLSERSLPAQAPTSDAAGEERSQARDVGRGSGSLASTLERAEASRDESELADLHLQNAREKLAAGRVDEAADHLRKSIRVAAKIGKKKVHAEARLELAEIARAEGDLTTACEHWQIARGLFFDLKGRGELEKTETLMRQHGCPTDWVLNDF